MRTIFDIWLDRGMKIAGIGGFCWAVFLFFTGMMGLPGKVTALESRQVIEEASRETDHEDIIRMQKDIQYIRASVTIMLKKGVSNGFQINPEPDQV